MSTLDDMVPVMAKGKVIPETPSGDEERAANASSRGRREPLPPGDDVGAAQLARRVAEALKDRRKVRGLSLDELARASGVSRAALSQIETLKSNPSLSVLWKIAAGLQIPFSELLGETGPAVGLLRRNDAQVLRSADGRLESRPATPAGFSRDIEMYELRLAGRATHFAEGHAPGTKELIIVLAGLLRMHVGNDKHDLSPGDALTFPADRPHAYENPSGGEARYHNLIFYSR